MGEEWGQLKAFKYKNPWSDTPYFKGLDKRRETDKDKEAYLTAGNTYCKTGLSLYEKWLSIGVIYRLNVYVHVMPQWS